MFSANSAPTVAPGPSTVLMTPLGKPTSQSSVRRRVVRGSIAGFHDHRASRRRGPVSMRPAATDSSWQNQPADADGLTDGDALPLGSGASGLGCFFPPVQRSN